MADRLPGGEAGGLEENRGPVTQVAPHFNFNTRKMILTASLSRIRKIKDFLIFAVQRLQLPGKIHPANFIQAFICKQSAAGFII